jgi:exopolysaccharide biosynthesis polyprenyl glycosylphosphotransferase
MTSGTTANHAGTRHRSLMTTFWLPAGGSLLDVIAIVIAAMIAFYLRFSTPVARMLHPSWNPTSIEYLVFGLILGVVYVILSWSYRHYSAQTAVPLDMEIGRILRGSVLSMGLVMAGIFFYRQFSYSRLVFLMTLVLMFPTLIISRVIYQKWRKNLFRRGIGVLRIALWGTGAEAVRSWNSLQHGSAQGFELIGFIGVCPVPNSKTLGDVAALRRLWSEYELDAIMLAPSADEEPQIGEVARAVEGTPIELLYVPPAVDVSRSRVQVSELGGKPVLKLKTLPMSGAGYVLKRLMDFAVSALVLVLLSWLYLLIALAVRLVDGSPVFYKQRRVGMDGREFNMLKFRTMRTNAEGKTGAVWAAKNDPRVTPFGRFLRRWSLDELPQFWSVLKGEMSLVGPRPERPEFVDKFAEYVPSYLDRHRVKSGLTGWAVIHGFRGSLTTIEERTEYDLYYVENWTLWLDIRILLRTIAAVISGKGAM